MLTSTITATLVAKNKNILIMQNSSLLR